MFKKVSVILTAVTCIASDGFSSIIDDYGNNGSISISSISQGVNQQQSSELNLVFCGNNSYNVNFSFPRSPHTHHCGTISPTTIGNQNIFRALGDALQCTFKSIDFESTSLSFSVTLEPGVYAAQETHHTLFETVSGITGVLPIIKNDTPYAQFFDIHLSEDEKKLILSLILTEALTVE